jgi:hypothetical protein
MIVMCENTVDRLNEGRPHESLLLEVSQCVGDLHGNYCRLCCGSHEGGVPDVLLLL